MVRVALACALGIMLAACTSTPVVRGEAPVAADQSFNVGGRLSAKRGTSGAAAVFDWDHAPSRDRIDLSSPFGQVYARIDGASDRVIVERADGTKEAFRDWRAMTDALLGAPVPMDDLAYWIRGVARAGAQSSAERDSSGRVVVLRQQAWEIVYAYPDDAPSARPSRLVLKYPDVEPVEVRVVVDRWNDAQAIR
ncbi:MAG TPA: lipoprotein insertase outer membrane protein LolB [Casimicrobiaceae bacterium]|nr:lipoprotein insertase outer membrane protein LolB [Casimicrobiaceae bacterium]